MVDLEFERRLERLFADAPELADAGSFAERVERRLDAGWTARRWLIGAAGVVGGVIGASQLMMSDLFQRVEAAGDSARVLSTSLSGGLNHISSGADWVAVVSSGGGGGVVVWVAAGLAVVMMGFVVTRVIGEI
jgi:hypothetical protein